MELMLRIMKKASEDNQQQVPKSRRRRMKKKKLLKESNEAIEEIEKHCQDVENKCKEQLEEKENEIASLVKEIRNAKDFANGMNKETIEKIFPAAAATIKVLHSGMTLTELYVEYTRLQEELQQKNDNSNLTEELKQIITEIEEKTPLINQRMSEYEKSKETISCLKSQLVNALLDYEIMLEERNDAKRISNLADRENSRLKNQVMDLNRQEIEEKTPLINQGMSEYEKSKETISCLKSQLANALSDYEIMLEERNDAKRISNLTERENSRLKNQVMDLNRQVQVLLKEVEEARDGHIRHDSSKIRGDDIVTSSDEVTADKIISHHSVTFRSELLMEATSTVGDKGELKQIL